MFKSFINYFKAKCDVLPEIDPKTSSDGEFPDDQYFALDMYPERRGVISKPSWSMKVFAGAGRDERRRTSCQMSIYKGIKRNPILRLLLSALDNSGCPVDIPRLFQCENCHSTVCGGYDADYNQIVICHNNIRAQKTIEAVLIHELIHVFDHCRNKLDFRNNEHVACTEIRAANLIHSSFFSCVMDGSNSFFNFKGRHKDCVRSRAIKTMITSRRLSVAEATILVDKVFDRCYADMEPFGRRVLTERAAEICEREGKYFGY